VCEFFCFKIETKNKVDLYMPCEAMAYSIVDDDGRKQGGKKTVAHASEFQKVNNFRAGSTSEM
jgi:hypothetical protein